MKLADRFWAKVDRRGEDECWPWTGGREPRRGYGIFRVGSRTDGSRRSVKAHRLAFELTFGPLPQTDLFGKRVCVLHTCDNPPCCNPAHLRSGTQGANLAEMAARGRGRNQHTKG